MRILLLTHSFNSLAQRLFVELAERGHELSIEFDVNDRVTIEAVDLFRPDLIVAPYLRRAIPEAVWRNHVCLVVHPGIAGDRGPSALDWAILEGEEHWGVTVLQAIAEMDAGPIWATAEFPMRPGKKSSLYRNEATEAAVGAVLEAAGKFAAGTFRPRPLDAAQARGRLRPLMTQESRRIDWAADSTATILRKIRSGDGFPGVLDTAFGEPFYLYDAHLEGTLRGGAPGEIFARRHGAVCVSTRDGAVWIGHLKPRAGEGEASFKLPAVQALGNRLAGVPESDPGLLPAPRADTWQDIAYEERDGVGWLHFDFYNGAMSTAQCERLAAAFREAARRPTRVIVLAGGRDFWSNGIHLNTIEAAASPADESWRNIDAIDDVALAVLSCDTHLTVAALQGNAGAGGVFLALAADRVVARRGVILNPHYKGMGNLYGSEYWTYLLPRRVGADHAREIMQNRLPLWAPRALAGGLVDDCYGDGPEDFRRLMEAEAVALAARPDFGRLLEEKKARRAADEAAKPLARYREEELDHMKLNFYGFDPSYHVARYNFVHKVAHSRTPLHLAGHRRLGWKRDEPAREEETAP